MNDVKMKTTVWAKKLRARMAELKTRRASDLQAFAVAKRQWMVDLEAWLRANAKARIQAITTENLTNHAYDIRRDEQPGFSIREFFKGAPRPPRYPKDELPALRSELRRLSITGVEHVSVGEGDVRKFFGNDGMEED